MRGTVGWSSQVGSFACSNEPVHVISLRARANPTTCDSAQVQGRVVLRAEGTATLMTDQHSTSAEAMLRQAKIPVAVQHSLK